MIYIFLYKIL
jgi:cAMP-dependent protein kinase regulator